MKYLAEYRDPKQASQLVEAIRRAVTRPWSIMEVCGGQTHAIVKHGIDQLLPPEITLLHGPGCPVCVTPVGTVDKALAIAERSGTILCSFGDMLRVPGTRSDLLKAMALGADVRAVYSPLDAVEIARQHPESDVVFFSVGFETTAPASALAVYRAQQAGMRNFTILAAHVRVPPALEAILSSPTNRVQAFLAAGHVCTVTGYTPYEPLAQQYGVPIVVTGFEPVDILHGLYLCVRQLEEGRAVVENAYSRSVSREGNTAAQFLMETVFEAVPRKWRGIGEIPLGGLKLRARFEDFDAERRFGLADVTAEEPAGCLGGDVLRGERKPQECPLFGTGCTPERPLGAPMVSPEGACAAYYRYRRA